MGILIVVPTPIGNLEDITLRAIRSLQEAETIYSEDTRVTKKLLNHLEISGKQLVPFHAHNEHKQLERCLETVRNNTTTVLVSDAGTPAISDPGFLLVRECLRNEIEVECLPGPTAFVPALVNSGLPCDKFVFEGFLPVKKGRQTRMKALAEENRTMIFYESPFRLVKTLEQFIEYFGAERQACVSREITKMFEENVRGTLPEIIASFANRTVKGEIVIVVAGKE